jgi:mono/diheme cytochrome c family protein
VIWRGSVLRGPALRGLALRGVASAGFAACGVALIAGALSVTTSVAAAERARGPVATRRAGPADTAGPARPARRALNPATVAQTTLAPTTLAPTTLAPTTLDGQTLFRSRCGVCHLAGGTGTFMLGRRLGPSNALLAERTNLDPAYVRQVVRNGIVSMPRITRAEVSDAELQGIIAYLTRNSP